MSPDTESFDLAELSERADVSVRTIRYYIQQGLLPAPEARGPGAHYGAEHLDRLRLVRRMQREHLPLAEIRRRLERLGAAAIRRLAAETEERPRSSARDYIREALSAPSIMLREEAPPPLLSALPLEADATMAGEGPSMEARAPAARPARSQWDRMTLAPDVELHVRRPLSREQNRQVERLLDAARNIFEEDAR